uniref:ATP-grasp domain-containing protein n=1 Tax=Compsopogon caeruleus TaxID=31354 RepID=A0A7S1TGQ0_9RHOD|mmetsp:Transcript_6660/g.13527  ORF Transcript_6660/g.13527 Transcript_6660/m.13527 type:complete len:547 (+) Transcript_6660:50-1690(+)|eukprot:CAMPEP_0184677880 /NCGR_PEP_ID=MMETSP0312-20130426/496_1 /TAXON_ID=31354 /ORGANISM="Compsopogon coeruleus, Strain SAG 36.94" /LENGTH=546 /DNA_ID=CAMNT_0027126077 /DNA_START=368 /DNA_END=2008 /DNA_ORIENTATION=-
MASYSSTPVDFLLDKRYRPGLQRERVPLLDELETDENEVSVGSLRASNFMRRSSLIPCDSPVIEQFREGFSASLMSPVFKSLNRIRPELLRVSSTQAQELRRKLVRGANVLIIMGGYSGKQFIYEKLQELGILVTILDGPNSPWKIAHQEKVIHDFIELDLTDWDTVFERAMEAVVAVETTFDAVSTYFEDAVPLAARIASALGLEVNRVESCDQARNKHTTRRMMRDAGLPCPKFVEIEHRDDLEQGIAEVGFPAILKPIFGAASMGVMRVNDEKEVYAAYDKVMKFFSHNEDPLWQQGKEMILEEYYDGDEFDIDILLSDGVVVYAKISDNWKCFEPYFQETGTICPSAYPPAKQQELIKLSIDTTLMLGFRWGAFHVECRYTSRGPRLIEVNARMGGMSVRDANLLAWGVDLVEEHIFSALKIFSRPVIPEKPLLFFAETGINAPYSGVVNSSDWLECIRSDPRVRMIVYCKKKGEKVTGPKNGMPDWLAEVRATSEHNIQDVLEFLSKTVRGLAVPVTPNNPDDVCDFMFPDDAHPFVPVLE